MSDGYADFLVNRRHSAVMAGFAATPPSYLYDFQAALVEWALRLGRAAIFASPGMGKTPMQLAWSQAVIEKTNRPVLIVAPLAVSSQTLREAEKFGVRAVRSQDGRFSGNAEVVVTNYERLEHFDPSAFSGAVCDESSILKSFDGVRKAQITEFMRAMSYRLLCTATPAPNDYIELGTSSEALGQMGYMDMLSRFFKNDEGSIAPLSYESKWRLKPHARIHFWRWLCSWARAIRKPSDLDPSFNDARFALPPLNERVTIIPSSRPLDGKLFVMPAADLHEQRQERRATLADRCAEAARIVSSHDRPFLMWAHLNDEGDLLARLLKDAVQVSGKDEDDDKIEKFEAFATGRVRGLITKAKIGGLGLNWQHCADMTTFPSHSWEQYYQGVHRCWRFGQTRPVNVDIISTEGEADVLGSLKRKALAADVMFAEMIGAMREAMTIAPRPVPVGSVVLPSWMERCAEVSA